MTNSVYANAQANGGDTRTAELDAWLRQRLADEGVRPEHIEIEFERVMQVVFAVEGASALPIAATALALSRTIEEKAMTMQEEPRP